MEYKELKITITKDNLEDLILDAIEHSENVYPAYRNMLEDYKDSIDAKITELEKERKQIAEWIKSIWDVTEEVLEESGAYDETLEEEWEQQQEEEEEE